MGEDNELVSPLSSADIKGETYWYTMPFSSDGITTQTNSIWDYTLTTTDDKISDKAVRWYHSDDNKDVRLAAIESELVECKKRINNLTRLMVQFMGEEKLTQLIKENCSENGE